MSRGIIAKKAKKKKKQGLGVFYLALPMQLYVVTITKCELS